MSAREARRTLAKLWIVGIGLLFLLMLAQTVLGFYGDNYRQVLTWITSCMVPVFALVIGVFNYDRKGKAGRHQRVDVGLFKLCRFLSVLYVSALIITILIGAYGSPSSLSVLASSQPLLVLFQGYVCRSLGAFYVSNNV